MANYYQYEYTSPIPTYALIKEELKSYFATGVLDDLLFPIWTEKCLRDLGRGSNKIEEAVLFIEDFKAKLPSDFMYVREAWLATSSNPIEYKLPGAYYHTITERISDNPAIGQCGPTTCDPCQPDRKEVYYRTTTNGVCSTNLIYLLRPGTVATKDFCNENSPNIGVSTPDSFEIRNGNLFTNFRQGEVLLTYYSKQVDEEGNTMIPDNYTIIEYIEAYIKYKLYHQLWDTVTDETERQIYNKVQIYDVKQSEARINAKSETRRKTLDQRVRDIKKSTNRLNRFKL